MFCVIILSFNLNNFVIVHNHTLTINNLIDLYILSSNIVGIPPIVPTATDCYGCHNVLTDKILSSHTA